MPWPSSGFSLKLPATANLEDLASTSNLSPKPSIVSTTWLLKEARLPLLRPLEFRLLIRSSKCFRSLAQLHSMPPPTGIFKVTEMATLFAFHSVIYSF